MLITKNNFYDALDSLILVFLTVIVFITSPLNTIFVMVNFSIMSYVGILGGRPKEYKDIIASCLLVGASALIGNILYNYHILHVLIFIIYAGLSCYLPKYGGIFKTGIITSGAIMFLIYSGVPFDYSNIYVYSKGTLIILAIYIIYYFIRDSKFKQKKKEVISEETSTDNSAHKSMALIAIVSITIAYFTVRAIMNYHPLNHNYWIPLTCFVIIQHTHRKTIAVTIRRILVNFTGALITLVCFYYIFPKNNYFYFGFLVFTMFFIFLFASTEILRIFFIELFVFGLAIFLNNFFLDTGVERVVDTFIGGIIVLIVTLLFHISQQAINKYTAKPT